MKSNITIINNRLALCVALIAVAFPAIAAATGLGENYELRLENGLIVRLYGAQEILNMTSRNASEQLILSLPDGTSYRLIDDLSDPQIASKGDGAFHPMDVDLVMSALSSIDIAGSNLDMRVNVYVLPFPRSGFLSSSTCGRDIFLSPGVYEINGYYVAFTVAHEMGHVFQQQYVPVSSAGAWYDYLTLRGLYDNPLYADDSSHMNRPAEIFAEDFRYLFGGSDARYSGTIENPNISLPDQVPGLREFFLALVASEETAVVDAAHPSAFSVSNYPNPFNPSTTIRVVFDGGAPAAGRQTDISVYRADGSLVRNLYHGRIMNNELSVRWDGRDARGREVASGVYFYSVESADRSASGKLLLTR